MMVVRQVLAELRTRLRLLVSRAAVREVDSGSAQQLLRLGLLGDEERRGVPHVEPYGFTSAPKEGSEAVAVFPQGDRGRGLVVVVGDRRFRLKGLKPGEVALYTDEGDRIHFRRGGEIDVQAGNLVRLSAPQVRIEGDLVVTGDVTDQVDDGGLSMAAMRQTYNSHTHPVSGGTAQPTTQQMS